MTRSSIRSSLSSIRAIQQVSKALSIMFPIVILYPLASLPSQEKQDKRSTLARYEVRFFQDESITKHSKSPARAAVARLQGVSDLHVATRLASSGIGVATFALPRENVFDWDELVERLAATSSHVFYVRRTDRGLLQNLRLKTRRARLEPGRKRLLAHKAVRPVLRAFDVLRSFRSVARSRTSSYAVTPALDSLLLELDAHGALLRARGVKLPAREDVTTAYIGERLRKLSKKDGMPTLKLWMRSASEAVAAAARLIEVQAFEHHAAALRSVATDATARASRITGDTRARVRARARHEVLATHARELAELVDRALSGVKSRCPDSDIFCR
jgi:hypothetical protein